MKKTLFIILFFYAHLYAKEPTYWFGIDIGQSQEDINIYRAVLKKEFIDNLYDSTYFTIKGYHEISLNHWNANENNSINALAYSPVFTLNVTTNSTFKPYLEGGIGLAYISHKHIDQRQMSTNFQFEDRVGIGFKHNDLDFYIRYMHYSNAGIKFPNDGIDIGLVGVSYKF